MQAVNNVDGVAKKKCDNAEGDVHRWGSFGGDRVERVGKSIDEEVGKDQDYVTKASHEHFEEFLICHVFLWSRLILSEVSAQSFPAAGVMGLR